jgi:hypothetical protein
MLMGLANRLWLIGFGPKVLELCLKMAGFLDYVLSD